MRWLIVLLIVALLVSCVWALYPEEETVTIASWNLHVFGDKKAGDHSLLESYAERISRYDIILLQEIRDLDGSAWRSLCDLLVNYTCVASSRAGSTSSKEQYVLVFREGVTLLSFIDFSPSYSGSFERPPVRAMMSVDGLNITLFGIHVRPDSARRELLALERLVLSSSAPSDAVAVLGDLNADCNYYDEREDLVFSDWRWAIADRHDTTVSSSDCAYDRIILNRAAEGALVRSGIDRDGITADISDHYIVWASFGT